MRLFKRLAAATTLSMTAAGAFAHDGHGLQGNHWHATDTTGFLVVALLAAVAILLSRGD